MALVRALRRTTGSPARLAGALLLLAPLGPGCSGGSSSPAPTLEPVHPLLVVRAADLPELRARAGRSPWRELAQAALRYAEQESFDPLASDFEGKTRMTDLCGALALAHVLDPAPAHVQKLRATLAAWPDFFLASAPSGDGLLVRWRQSAMIQTIVALDVMHAALEPDERAGYERMLDGMVSEWWRLRAQDGTTSTPGVTLVWALYRGDRALLAASKRLYLERLFAGLAPSGVYSAGTGYAWVRHGGDRISKYAPIDVLVFTGEEPGLYADPRLVGLHEWMFAGAYTPMRTNTTFGDSDPTRPIEGLLGYMQPYGAGRYSARAGRNAAWLVRDVEPRPLLSNYVLMDEALLAPEPPESGLYGDTATFYEDAGSSDSLMGALWSARTSASHSHKDVNSVHLYAYGRNVLRNSGYCGSGLGIDGTFDWEWVSNRAASSNTLRIDGRDHVAKTGAGLREGLVTPTLDYAAAGSGPALPNGSHERSLLLVHGEPERPGYFVLLDLVQAAAPRAEAQLALHPEARVLATLAPLLTYESLQGQAPDELRTTLFLASEPLRATILDGGLCAFDGEEFVGAYLEASYATDAAGRRNVVSLVVPHDARHPAPALERLPAAGDHSGARLSYGAGVVDVVLESDGDRLVVPLPEAFQGQAALHRRVAGRLTQYFVCRGRAFDDGGSPMVGFTSDAEVSLVVRGTAVHVTSAGATVTFLEPSLTGALIQTSAGTVLSAEPGRLVIRLAPGSHAFDLATGLALGRSTR